VLDLAVPLPAPASHFAVLYIAMYTLIKQTQCETQMVDVFPVSVLMLPVTENVSWQP